MIAVATLATVSAPANAQMALELESGVFGSSNAFLLADDDKVTIGGEVIVSSKGEFGIDARTSVEADADLAFRQYSRRFGDFLTGRAAAILHHRRDEFLSLQTDFFYDRFLPTEALGDSIDAAIDPIALREDYGARQSITWNPSARTAVTGLLSWTQTQPVSISPLSETSVAEFALGAERKVSPFLSLGAGGGYLISESEDGYDSTVKTFRLTADYRLASYWRAAVELGVEEQDLSFGAGEPETGPVQFSGSGLLCVEPQRATMCFSAVVRSVASGIGVLRATSFGAQMDYRLSEYGAVSFTADYRKAPGADQHLAAEVLAINSRYEHRLSRAFYLLIRLDYLQRSSLPAGKIDAVAGRIGVSFRICPS